MVVHDTVFSADFTKKATVSFCGRAEQHVVKFYNKADNGIYVLDVNASIWVESYKEAVKIVNNFTN